MAAAGFAWFSAALTTLLPLVASPAAAQVGVSASLLTDYLYRGVSLSDGRPAASLTLSYDHPSGAYGGLTASSARWA